MNKIWTVLFLTAICSTSLFANDKLKIQINRNVELLGLAYFIGFEGQGIESATIEIGGNKIPKKDWHNFGFMLYEKYKTHAASENLGKSFSVADHLWLDYIIAFLLQVESVPNAKLTDNIDESYYINFSKKKDIHEAKQNVILFLDGFNAFCREINFDQYMLDSKSYYDKSIEEIKKALPRQDFINTMERFYKTEFDSYSLIPSLTIPKGMGFGLKFTLNEMTNVFNVFGALDFQDFKDSNRLKMGFENEQKLRELSVHEFGHSFVNPIVGELPEETFKKTEKLFEPLKSKMGEQGYNNWKVCVYEHFVRAGEIFLSEKLGDKERTEKLKTEYVQGREFKYIPVIIPELSKFSRGEYKTYSETVRKTMDILMAQATTE
jgi:hypothetical protein